MDGFTGSILLMSARNRAMSGATVDGIFDGGAAMRLSAVDSGAGWVGKDVPVGGEENGEADGEPEEEANGEGGGEGLAGVRVGAGGPAEEYAGGQGDAAGDEEPGGGQEETVLPVSCGKEEGVDDDGIERDEGREEGERFGEVEKHGVLHGGQASGGGVKTLVDG